MRVTCAGRRAARWRSCHCSGRSPATVSERMSQWPVRRGRESVRQPPAAGGLRAQHPVPEPGPQPLCRRIRAGRPDRLWLERRRPSRRRQRDGWMDLYVLNMQGHDEYHETLAATAARVGGGDWIGTLPDGPGHRGPHRGGARRAPTARQRLATGAGRARPAQCLATLRSTVPAESAGIPDRGVAHPPPRIPEPRDGWALARA